jgi:Icc protein
MAGLQYAVDLGPVRLVVLDTVVPQEGRGRLCKHRLRWLDERLAENPQPTLIAMHHPPFATGIAHMDALGLEGADALEQRWPPPARARPIRWRWI